MFISVAWVAKLVDAVDSKSTAFGCAGSSPALGTTGKYNPQALIFNQGFFVCA
jgi:hypothetical protein